MHIRAHTSLVVANPFDYSDRPTTLSYIGLLGPFYGTIAVPSVARCRCCRCCCGHRFYIAIYSYSWLRLILVVVSTVARPGEWQCKIRTGGVRRLAVANGPNIFQMLLVFFFVLFFNFFLFVVQCIRLC